MLFLEKVQLREVDILHRLKNFHDLYIKLNFSGFSSNSLPVSESGFYKWKRNREKPKAWQKLLSEIHKILEEDEENKNYGVERMKIALEQRGIKRSFSTVKRAMAHGNLLHEDRRSPDRLTKADKNAMKAQNIIKQDFTADAPLRKLLTDITQIQCKNGKLYVSPLLDCFNGEIISLVMDTNMKKELCIKTITEAYKKFDIKSGVIIHSDSGSQYTSEKYKKTLGQLHAVQSMSGGEKMLGQLKNGKLVCNSEERKNLSD